MYTLSSLVKVVNPVRSSFDLEVTSVRSRRMQEGNRGREDVVSKATYDFFPEDIWP